MNMDYDALNPGDAVCSDEKYVMVFALAERYKGLLVDAIDVFNEYSEEESEAKSQLIQAGFVTKITEWADAQRTVFEEQEDRLREHEVLLRSALVEIIDKANKSDTALPESVSERLAILKDALQNLESENTVQALALVTARLMSSCKDVIDFATEQNIVSKTEQVVQQFDVAYGMAEQTLSEIASTLMVCLEKANDCANLILYSIQSEFSDDPGGLSRLYSSGSGDGVEDGKEEFDDTVADPAAWKFLAVFAKNAYAEHIVPIYAICVFQSTLGSFLSSTDTVQGEVFAFARHGNDAAMSVGDIRPEKQGYIYAMINPSIKGMIKVGKTKRDPEERARELSAHTGVPTAYMVAYAAEVGDCDRAERYVHSRLAENNFRVSNNREFFSAPLNDVIDIMRGAEQLYGVNEHRGGQESAFGRDGKIESSEALELFERGEDLLWGAGDDESRREARGLFKKAAKLGYGKAYYALGTIFDLGLGVQKNSKQAQTYYNEAVYAGCAQANIAVATEYARLGDIASAFDCWKSYLCEIENYDRLEARREVFLFIGACYDAKKTPPLLKRLSFLREDLLRFGQERIENEQTGKDFGMWVKKICKIVEQQVPPSALSR